MKESRKHFLKYRAKTYGMVSVGAKVYQNVS